MSSITHTSPEASAIDIDSPFEAYPYVSECTGKTRRINKLSYNHNDGTPALVVSASAFQGTNKRNNQSALTHEV